jgi:hypothetical protein
MRIDPRHVNLGSVVKAAKPPMKQSKNSLLTRTMMYKLLLQVVLVLLGMWMQAVLGLCERIESACCRTTVNAKFDEVLTTR